MALALVAAFAMPAAAASKVSGPDKVKFYGAVKHYTFSKDISNEQVALGNGSVGTPGTYNDDDTDLKWRHHGSHTNFGARGQTGALKWRVEWAWEDGNGRHWYGEWDFGPASILVGNTSNIEHMSVGICEPGTDRGMLGGSNRVEQIQLKFKIGPAKVILAAMRPMDPPARGTTISPGADETDFSLPKLGARVEFGVGPIKVDIAGTYQTYEEVDTATNRGFDIDSSALLSRFRATFGPLHLRANLWTATNLGMHRSGNAGSQWGGATRAAFRPVFFNNAIQDTDEWGWGIRGTFRFNKMIALHAQYGMYELSQPVAGAIDNERTDKVFAIALPITLVKGFTLQPFYEVEEFELETAATRAAGTTDQGEIKFLGAMWLLRF
jgi:hypothetical protein